MLQHPGKRISSANTFFLKRVFPVLWLAFLAVPVTICLATLRGPHPVPGAVLAPLLLCPLGFWLMRKLVSDLADEVYDEGDALWVRFGADSERIALANISNVSYAGMTNPQRVTLTLRVPGRFGKEVTFSPPRPLLAAPFRPNPLVNELIERVDAARRR
jgi:hypothetical protein